MRPRVVAIVPSAGFGKRLGMKAKKPFVMLGGKPLVYYALKALNSCGSVDSIIIASEKCCVKRFKRLVSKFRLNKVKNICVGGKTRFESVRNALKLVGDSYDIVLIHDGARPFPEKNVISDSIDLAHRFGGCIVAVPESDTVKITDKNLFISKTLDRKRVYRAQTPQVFRRKIIQRAYAASRGDKITDDASLVEMGVRVKILAGSYRNIKVTTKEDLRLAEVLL